MNTPRKQMHLGAFFFGVGHHLAAWRHPDVDPEAASRIESLKEWTRITAYQGRTLREHLGLARPAHPGACIVPQAHR